MALARNSLLNLAPALAGVAVSILTVPFYISIIGTERYGALLLALVLLGYFGQADFGLGRSITQRLSSIPDASDSERASVVWSALVGATVISLVGGALVFVSANVFFQSLFEVSPNLKAEVLEAAWLFALCVPVIMFTGVSSGALVGVQRFGIVSLGTLAGNILSQVLPLLVALFYSKQFEWLLAASIAGRLIGLGPMLLSMVFVFLRGQPVNPSVPQLRRLFSFGSWIMVTAIVGPLMTTADRFVVGSVLGSVAVVAYSVPTQIVARTVMFPMAFVQALFPRLAAQTKDESTTLGKVSVVLVGQFFAFVVTGLMFFAAPLLTLWIGEDLDQRSVLVGQIALVGIWFNALANVPYALVQARGNSRYTALLHVIELPAYLIMLYAFGNWLGLNGVALASTARIIIDCLALFHKAEFLDRLVLCRLAGPMAVVLGSFVMSLWVHEWLGAFVGASCFCSVLLLLTWFQIPDEAKDRLRMRLRR